jgi:hypothetical protein
MPGLPVTGAICTVFAAWKDKRVFEVDTLISLLLPIKPGRGPLSEKLNRKRLRPETPGLPFNNICIPTL